MNRPEHIKPKKSSQKPGFYVALALCVLAIAAAAWSTYDSIAQFTHFTPKGSSSAQSTVQSKVQSTASRPVFSSAVVSHAPGSQPADSAPVESTPAVSAAAEPQEPDEPVTEEVQMPPFQRPVEGGLVCPYTTDLQYSKTMRDWRVHTGADYAAQSGESVYAVCDGEVTAVEQDLYYGNTVTVQHGAYTVHYCGLGENIPVTVGQQVNAGSSLGVVTAVPCEAAEASHLHLQAEENGTPIDPEVLF